MIRCFSPRHANFIYQNGQLHVLDEGSVNGVFVRIKTPTTVGSGALFLIGEQLLQVEPSPPDLGPRPTPRARTSTPARSAPRR